MSESSKRRSASEDPHAPGSKRPAGSNPPVQERTGLTSYLGDTELSFDAEPARIDTSAREHGGSQIPVLLMQQSSGTKQRRDAKISEPSSLLHASPGVGRSAGTGFNVKMVEALGNNPLFASLGDSQKTQVCAELTARAVARDEVVVTEGEMGTTMFIVDSGRYEMFIGSQGASCLRTFTHGESFGELALMFSTPRTASIRCCEAGQLWELGRVTFQRLVLVANQSMLDDKLHFLKAVPLLSGSLTPQQAALSHPTQVICVS